MKTIDEIGMSLKNIIYISDPIDGFFITIPGHTDLVGQVFVLPEYKGGTLFQKSTYPSIDEPKFLIKLYSVATNEHAIYLTPTPEPTNRWVTIALGNCYGGLDVLNHLGKNVYIKQGKQFVFTNPVTVPIRKNIAIIDPCHASEMIKEILQTKSDYFFISPHYGRQCFQIYFSYKQSIVDHIKSKIPKGKFSFQLENFSWQIDFSCRDDVVNLLNFINKEFLNN